MGVTVKTENEPLRAAVKTIEYNPTFRDGSIDYSDMEGLHYEDKVIDFKVQFKADNLAEMRQKFKVLAKWLSGKGVLRIGNTVYLDAKAYGGIDTLPQMFGRYAEFNVQFRVPPFSVESTVTEEIEFSSGDTRRTVVVDTDHDTELSFNIYCSGAMLGQWGNFEFNGFEYNGVLPDTAVYPIFVNGNDMTVTYKGANYARYCNYVFPKFLSGSNSIEIYANFDGEIDIDYYPKRFF